MICNMICKVVHKKGRLRGFCNLFVDLDSVHAMLAYDNGEKCDGSKNLSQRPHDAVFTHPLSKSTVFKTCRQKCAVFV